MSSVVANEGAMAELERGLQTAGEDYKSNYAKLTSLVQEITNGDITGDAATDLVNKFEAKREMLDTVQQAIDEANDFITERKASFNSMMNGLMEDMK